MGKCLQGHFAVSLLHVMTWKLLTKYGKLNWVFHSDKICADSKYLKRFVSEMILWFS